MKFLSNAHTHTTFCDGRSTIGEQIAAAQRLGFVSLGFSGHAMQGFDWAYCMSPDAQAAYYASLRGAQAALRAAGALLTLHVGLEQDALVPDDSKAQNRRVYDYLIGSTHPAVQKNQDIETGDWRRLNLERPPFCLGDSLIPWEPDGPAQDGYLGAWDLQAWQTWREA